MKKFNFREAINISQTEMEYLTKLVALNVGALSKEQQALLENVKRIEESGEDWEEGQNNLYDLYFNQGMIAGMEFVNSLIRDLIDFWDENNE